MIDRRCPHGRRDIWQCIDCHREKGHVRELFMPILTAEPSLAAFELETTPFRIGAEFARLRASRKRRAG